MQYDNQTNCSHTRFAVLLACLDIDCQVSTLFRSFVKQCHDLLFLSSYARSISTHSTWNNGETSWTCYGTSYSSSRWVWHFSSTPSLLHLLSEFIGKLNDGFPQPIILKYKTHSLKGKFNSNRGNQGLKLTQRWWVDLSSAYAVLPICVM